MLEVRKTPEEIKKGLERDDCKKCPYSERNSNDGVNHCGEVEADALALIQQLERDKNWASDNYDLISEENKRLESENAQLKRERDAAVKDIYINSRCAACKKYFKNGGKCSGAVFCIPLEFEWRGPCEENGGQKEEEK